MNLMTYILSLSLLPFCIAKDTLPTFFIDYDHLMGHLFLEQNPFARTSNPQFGDIIRHALKLYAVVILFVEETLSTEDISLKDDRGTPFANLREEILKNKVKYIPNVDTPVKVFTSLLRPTQKNVYVLKPGQLFHSTEEMQYFYVFFNDVVNETRAEALRRHDLVIQHIYETIRKMTPGAVLGIYTGKVNPVNVFTSERGAIYGDDPYSPVDRGIVLASRRALFRFVGMTVDSADRTRRSFFEDEGMEGDDQLSKPSEDKVNQDGVQSKVSVGEYQLEFFFILQSTRWRLDRIKLYEATEWVGDHNMSTYIGAPYGRSYLCDEPLVFYNTRDRSAIIIPEYQIQPFRSEDIASEEKTPGTDEDGGAPPADEEGAPADEERRLRTGSEAQEGGPVPDEFGQPVKCTPYFTIGILTGLVVTFLCLAILLSGVFCLYHCETNDHFDDPQAKQIVIAMGD